MRPPQRAVALRRPVEVFGVQDSGADGCGMCADTLLAGGGRAAAQSVDFTFFIGRAFPIYDERLALRPPTPTVPGADVTVVGLPLIQADGGPVLGGALAVEWGILGVEGRLDATDLALDVTGARYDLRGNRPPIEGLDGKHHRGGREIRCRSGHALLGERQNPVSRPGGPRRFGESLISRSSQ